MILITGATGLVGSHLAFKLLSSGKKIRAIKRHSADIGITKKIFNYYSKDGEKLFNEIEWVEADVLDVSSLYDAMDEIEYVYHCAAMVSFNLAEKDVLMKINVEGTANVVNTALKRGVKKLCHVSSVAALGRSYASKALNEKTEWKDSSQNSNYAISKYRAEREVMRGVAEGLSAVIVNPSVIIGPGEWGKSSTNLFKIVWKGLKYYSKGINGYIDVRDVVSIMVQLMQSDISNERFILYADHLSYQKLFNTIALHLNMPQPSIQATPLLGEIAWRMEKMKSFFTGQHPFITKETARTANQKVFYENDKIKKTLNFSFIPIEQSIKDTAQIFLKDKPQ